MSNKTHSTKQAKGLDKPKNKTLSPNPATASTKPTLENNIYLLRNEVPENRKELNMKVDFGGKAGIINFSYVDILAPPTAKATIDQTKGTVTVDIEFAAKLCTEKPPTKEDKQKLNTSYHKASIEIPLEDLYILMEKEAVPPTKHIRLNR